MMIVAIICCIAFGAFEAAIYRNTDAWEDKAIAACAFGAGAFLAIMLIARAW